MWRAWRGEQRADLRVQLRRAASIDVRNLDDWWARLVSANDEHDTVRRSGYEQRGNLSHRRSGILIRRHRLADLREQPPAFGFSHGKSPSSVELVQQALALASVPKNAT
jgi:hypothetical protein